MFVKTVFLSQGANFFANCVSLSHDSLLFNFIIAGKIT